MKKTLFSFAALGALCAAPLFAQEVPRANQPDPPLQPSQPDDRTSEGAIDADAAPRAVPGQTQPGQVRPGQPGQVQPGQPRTGQPGQARPAGQAQPGQRTGAQGTNVQDTQESDFAQHVAACLILANKAEIALTESAMDKLENEQAREFAQMIIKDHTQFVSKLKQHAPQAANLELNVQGANRNAAGANASARANADDANSPADPAHANASRAQRSAAENMGDKALRVEKQYYENKVRMLNEKLSKQQGQDFLQAFLGAQVAGHVSMLSKLQALEGEVQDQQVSQLIQQAQETTQNHLQQAEQLMQQEKNVETRDGQNRAQGQNQDR